MNDYIDLETEIMNVGQIEVDLESLLYKVMDDPSPPSEDELGNLIIGMIAMHRVRFNKMFAVFEDCVKNKKLFNKRFDNIEMPPYDDGTIKMEVTDSEGSVSLNQTNIDDSRGV